MASTEDGVCTGGDDARGGDLEALASAASFDVEGDVLTLHDVDGGFLVFRPRRCVKGRRTGSLGWRRGTLRPVLRLLIRTVIWLGSAAIGLIVAKLVLDDMTIDPARSSSSWWCSPSSRPSSLRSSRRSR